MRKRKPQEPELTDAELRVLWDTLLVTPECIHCGGHHPWPHNACRRIKRIMFHQQNTGGQSPVQEVEYFETWDESATLYKHDLPERPKDDDT